MPKEQLLQEEIIRILYPHIDDGGAHTVSMDKVKRFISLITKHTEQQILKAKIDELSFVWYDKKLGLVLAHGTGINDRIQTLRKDLDSE